MSKSFVSTEDEVAEDAFLTELATLCNRHGVYLGQAEIEELPGKQVVTYEALPDHELYLVASLGRRRKAK